MRSPWTLPVVALGMVLWASFLVALWLAMWRLHLLRFPGGSIAEFMDSLGGFLAMFSMLLVAVPCGLMSANLIAWLIPPIRRSLDRVANFGESQKGLLRFARWVSAPAFVVGVVSALSGI